jgi:septal ring factor EnvC (AmiA/AmiB activator)
MQQHTVMTKTQETLYKDSQQQKAEIRRLQDKEARLYDTIHSLEKDIQSHKKEIREREETITDKEKRIFDLKKKNQVMIVKRMVVMGMIVKRRRRRMGMGMIVRRRRRRMGMIVRRRMMMGMPLYIIAHLNCIIVGIGEVPLRTGLQDQGAEATDRSPRERDQHHAHADQRDGPGAGPVPQEQ